MYRAFLLVLLIAACSNGLHHRQEASEEIAGTGPGEMSLTRLAGAQAAAKSGDITAMASLENHYAAAGDITLYRYWLERQVAAGSPYAMQRLSSYLQELGGAPNCVAAAAHLRRAIALADTAAFRQSLTAELDLVEGRVAGAPSCQHRPNNSFKPKPLRGSA